MEKIKETQKGFYGCYWPLEGSTCAIIAMLGDDCEDYMAKMAVKWMQNTYGVSMLTLSPGHKDYSHHNLPVERIGAAITYLKERGIKKIAIAGASTTGMYALIAASYYPEITLTIAMTPADFVMEGFYQGKRDGMAGGGRVERLLAGKAAAVSAVCIPPSGIRQEDKRGGEARQRYDRIARYFPGFRGGASDSGRGIYQGRANQRKTSVDRCQG